MAERKKRFFEFGAFPDFDEIEKMFDELSKDMMDESKWRQVKPGKPVVYGWSLQVGPDGKPHFEEFGNMSRAEPTKVKQEREPVVEVINGAKEVTVIAELPGVESKHVHLKVEKGDLELKVSDPERRYHKKLTLPAEVDAGLANAKLKNGILEVVLQKTRPSRQAKATEIKVS